MSLAPSTQTAVDKLNGRLTLSMSEAAAVLGITRQHLYVQVQRGVIPTISLGRRRLVRVAALERILADLEATGGDAA